MLHHAQASLPSANATMTPTMPMKMVDREIDLLLGLAQRAAELGLPPAPSSRARTGSAGSRPREAR